MVLLTVYIRSSVWWMVHLHNDINFESAVKSPEISSTSWKMFRLRGGLVYLALDFQYKSHLNGQ